MRPLVCALTLAALLLAGCGDDDDASADTDAADTEQVDADDGASASGDDDATSGGGGGGGEPADLGDFPIPAPPGSTEIARTEVEGIVAVTLSVPVDSYDDVVAFYDDWTAADADEYQRVGAESGGVSWVRTSDPDNPGTIMLSAPLEGDSETVLSLTSGG